MSAETFPTGTRWASIVGVWVATAVAAVLIGAFAGPDSFLGWLAIAMAGATLVAMCLQLATQEKRGFVLRMSASLSGSFVILGIATLILAIAHA